MTPAQQTALEALAGRPLTPAEVAMAEARQDGTLADSISAGRTGKASREIGDGTVVATLGVTDGSVFMYRLRALANTALPADATPEQITPVALAQQAVSSLNKTGFDVGSDAGQAGIDLFVGTLLTADQAAKLKALGWQAAPVSAIVVSNILNSVD